MPRNTVGAGFPFHFYEISYNDIASGNVIAQKFLITQFIGNILVYSLISVCFWHLLVLGFKKHKWHQLGLAIVAGIVSLIVNLATSDSCWAGFPIEFYSKCTGVGVMNMGIIFFGLIFDSIFWITPFIILVAVFDKYFSYSWFKGFLGYKDVWFTIISAWITLVVIFLLSIVARAVEFAGGAIIAVVCIPFLPKMHHYFKNRSTGEGKKFFFSKMGYIALGVSIGLVFISLSFNLFYKSGWFDFTDLGFVLLSYPLNMLIKFQVDSDMLSKRIILYLISFINLAIIIFILDVLGAGCVGIYRIVAINVKKIFFNNIIK
ncbi:MAG: hypothetical protein Q8Q48_03220 [Candidatus Staskawiczbacteria bacterium]|nr:hypothetical protein [Candidatus Staskawiczbacteria bacterium]